MRILIADDSISFRSMIKAALAGQAGLELVGVAATGKIALSKLRNKTIDLIILDLEMPDGDGLDVLRSIKAEQIPTKVILFAAPNSKNYGRIRKALQLGAQDFLAKPVSDDDQERVKQAVNQIKAILLPRIYAIQENVQQQEDHSQKSIELRSSNWKQSELELFRPRAVVIASSTGGPLALEKIFTHVKAPITVPILICQHMPPPFTKDLAMHLHDISGIVTSEGEDGETIEPNHIYIAPGNYHMKVAKNRDGAISIAINQDPPVHFVRPAADPLLTSAAEVFGSEIMGFVLTGMGSDGKEGACIVKDKGGSIMIQDKLSSTVWGMPGAVYEAGAYDRMGSIDECAAILSLMCTPRHKVF